jgi:hypothetical protein
MAVRVVSAVVVVGVRRVSTVRASEATGPRLVPVVQVATAVPAVRAEPSRVTAARVGWVVAVVPVAPAGMGVTVPMPPPRANRVQPAVMVVAAESVVPVVRAVTLAVRADPGTPETTVTVARAGMAAMRVMPETAALVSTATWQTAMAAPAVGAVIGALKAVVVRAARRARVASAGLPARRAR